MVCGFPTNVVTVAMLNARPLPRRLCTLMPLVEFATFHNLSYRSRPISRMRLTSRTNLGSPHRYPTLLVFQTISIGVCCAASCAPGALLAIGIESR